MTHTEIIWLASWPRSGNTFLRTILWQCFGLRSTSIYPTDVAENDKLADYVGHADPSQLATSGCIPLVKTHERQPNNYPAIYVVRNGLVATMSLWQFYRGDIPLDAIIEGRHRFGTWASHLQPWQRENTLFLRYEDMLGDLPAVLLRISRFLEVPILKDSVPDRNAIASVDGRFVKSAQHQKPEFPAELRQRFVELNGAMLDKTGYGV